MFSKQQATFFLIVEVCRLRGLFVVQADCEEELTQTHSKGKRRQNPGPYKKER
jgi:hypothetical protein